MLNNNPIAVFDSGVGGLSVWREIRKMLPAEPLIYFGDGLNCPYGQRPTNEVKALTISAVEWLVGQGAKVVVVACNTATAAAIDEVRARFAGTPIVGMVPAVKPAAAATHTGTVAILATARALEGGKLDQYIHDFAEGVEVITAVGEGFVELVELGRENTAEAVEVVQRVIEPLIARGADRIVLGCTHYPFLIKAFEQVIGARAVEIVDPAPAIARRVAQLLKGNGLAASSYSASVNPAVTPELRFHTLAGEDYLAALRRRAME